MIKGKVTERQNIWLDVKTVIRSLEEHEHYKYLGVEENEHINHKTMKKKLTQEYLRRTRQILKTELSARNKLSAITTLAVPVVQYSFGIVKWTLAEIRAMDRKNRKLLTMHGALHPRSDIDRLYISRRDGGRGLTNLETSHEIEIKGLLRYIELKQRDKYLGMVYRRNTRKSGGNILENTNSNTVTIPETKQVKKIKGEMRERKQIETKNRWKTKAMHGQILKEVEKDTINEKKSWEWLKFGDLKVETESLITACQEQSIATNYLKAKILKTGTDPNCRLCRTESETIHHVISGCSILAKNEYLKRHNAVAAHLHWNICKKYGVKVSDKWYEHKPEPVVNTEEITILWDSQIQTDRFIKANKPDLVLKDKIKKVCLLIEVAIPSDYNITQKEAEKRLKYKDLQIEIERMWGMRTKIIPVVIGATGLISHNTYGAMKDIPGKHHLLSLQKTVLLKTAHIVRKVL